VLVTGGDDKKVNMWAIGKPNCILVSIDLITSLTATLRRQKWIEKQGESIGVDKCIWNVH